VEDRVPLVWGDKNSNWFRKNPVELLEKRPKGGSTERGKIPKK